MRITRYSGGAIAALAVAGLTLAGAPALAATQHSSASRHTAATSVVAPTTWHVIAGFTQDLPAGNNSTEAVNQFYPRYFTIHAGDKVVWTNNATNEAHTVTFGPDSILRPLENPQEQFVSKMINGKAQLVVNPAVFFPSSPGPLVETDSGSAKTLVSCGVIGPAGTPNPQSCAITFPNVGSFSYDCLLHSGIPGFGDMDGTIKVVPNSDAGTHAWTIHAGSGTPTDANNGFVPAHLTIHVGDKVNWVSGGVLFHTVSFGIDPRKVALLVPVGKSAQGPILALNPVISTPVIPAGGIYTGGVASSGLELQGNYLNLPGQKYVKAAFSLTFAKDGTYSYNCLVHPGMTGTITVLPPGQ